MESIGALIWIVIIGVWIASASKKAKLQQQKKKETGAKDPAPAAPVAFPAAAKSAAPAPKAVKFPTPVRVSGSFSGSIPEGTDPCHERDLGGPDRMKPTLYGGSLGSYTGSLGVSTSEGFDPCHEDQVSAMTGLEVEDLSSSGGTAPALFNWSGNEVMKAVVMQEILKRPCERAAR